MTPSTASMMSSAASDLDAAWWPLFVRLQARGVMGQVGESVASLSLRLPGEEAMWWNSTGTHMPRSVAWQGVNAPAVWPGDARTHAAIYRLRPDVGAIAIGGGPFGLCLPDFGGTMPTVFDEQARHLGRMGPAVNDPAELGRSLAAGGNALLLQGRVVCLGATATRLALNAELFEKCAKAFVLAAATGGKVRPLPWLVRTIANGRLMKDEQRAMARFAQALLPEEAKGY
ncbi:hypothetical protein LRH25_16690 [Ideonella azotifigens]|uniref:Ribulose-5-phosphate 4-epimerase/Fuculose-1-phosphate aldolase n=1 Tax=Ideonella azotifigens TaxID=513160 RepID=A0ABN1JJA3_9BURK|nr:hypothetical protein [Ideonella azotifigens]MCD2341980.1 hypothetical protein [Ideonella azotifigens]